MPEPRTDTRVTFYVTATGFPTGDDRFFTEPQPVFIGDDVGMHHRYPGMWVKRGPTYFATVEEARSFLGHAGGAYGFRVEVGTIKIVRRTITTTTVEEDVPLDGEGHDA